MTGVQTCALPISDSSFFARLGRLITLAVPLRAILDGGSGERCFDGEGDLDFAGDRGELSSSEESPPARARSSSSRFAIVISECRCAHSGIRD